MKRVAGCLVVLFAIAAAWLGCRVDLDLMDREIGTGTGAGTGTGTDTVDAPVDVTGEGSGSADAAVDAPADSPGSGSDIDAAVDAPIGSSEAPGDAAGAPDARRNEGNSLDRTSFYACAGGGCGSTTGADVWLPLVVALGFGFRRTRARRRAD
jgi:MYXO-CTERM domain-containing protein